MSRESICRSELTDDTHLTVYAVSTQPVTESPTQVTIGAPSPSNDLTAEEPYTGFNAQIQHILSEADALHNEVDRQGLKEVLHKYKDSFAKDSLDCGLTNIHTVRIPTNPNAPPTFLRQFKIPIASNEPVQEIIDSMLEKGVNRPCNSTYSAPIRSNHAKRMCYDHGARSHNTYLTDTLYTSAELKEPPQPQITNHRHFEENVSEGMPTAYVDGCSYNRVVWLNNDPCPPQQLKLGPHSSQYAEIAAILITLQLAASHNIKITPYLY